MTGRKEPFFFGRHWKRMTARREPVYKLSPEEIACRRTLEETAAGLKFKPPKTKQSRRTVTLPESTILVLRDHRTQQLRERLQRGMGAAGKDALVFPCPVTDGAISPNKVTRKWRRLVSDLALSPVSFHALRHTHASALIAAGIDVVTVSRRLGHGSPSITLGVYAHMFSNTDDRAASAIEDALGPLG